MSLVWFEPTELRNYTAFMQASGLILALVVLCCSSRMSSVAQAGSIESNHTEPA